MSPYLLFGLCFPPALDLGSPGEDGILLVSVTQTLPCKLGASTMGSFMGKKKEESCK